MKILLMCVAFVLVVLAAIVVSFGFHRKGFRAPDESMRSSKLPKDKSAKSD